MADTMKTYPVICPAPECGEEFDADVPVEALLPSADAFDVECPECGQEWEIDYDAATDTLTLLPWEDEEGGEIDETSLTCEDDEPEDDE